jgi:hypothetical protein
MKVNHISPEFNYFKVNGTLAMSEKKSFFGSKLLNFEDKIDITSQNLIYYQMSSNEQLNLSVESFNEPIIYDTDNDKFTNSKLIIDNSQLQSQKDDKTAWILTINYKNILINYLFAEFKKWRTFEGVKNNMCLSNDVNKSIKEYITTNLINRYNLEKTDIFINYLNLENNSVTNNLRLKNTWDPNISNNSFLLKSFETNDDTIDGKLTINFNQEKTSLLYNYTYYYNLYFKKF